MSSELMERETTAVVTPSPMDMIAQAVARGTSVEELGKLMDLQERWSKEEARKAFIAAMNQFKANPPQIFKNKAVHHNGVFKYKHATLDNCAEAIGSALSKVGISYRWETAQKEGGVISVACILTHTMGHSERTPLEASPDQSGGKNSIQAVGSTVTYLQRYTLLAATGMAVENMDDDAQGGKRMSEDAKEQWMLRIAECKNDKEAGELWKQISKATTAAGDVEAHDELRAAMVAKRKELKKTITTGEPI